MYLLEVEMWTLPISKGPIKICRMGNKLNFHLNGDCKCPNSRDLENGWQPKKGYRASAM